MNWKMRRPAILLSVGVCLVLLLASCQRERPPIEEEAWPTSPLTQGTVTPAQVTSVPVQPGQTVIAVEGPETPAPASSAIQPLPQATLAPVVTQPAEVVIPVGPTFEYIVKPGDTLFSIAQTYGTDVETLRRLNDLPDDTIQSGQILLVPGSGEAVQPPAQPATTPAPTEPPAPFVYVVQLGDTLSSIADQFGVDWREIAAANGIAGPTYTIYRGQRLVIPGVTPTPVPTEALLTHTIQPGETLYSIAVRYGVTVQELMQANNLTDPDLIYPGQVLIIPER